jgi:hypothetical protein
MGSFSRLVTGLLAVSALTWLTTTPDHAIEIPKPIINIPKPNIPRPNINIPRPNVNIPRPHVTIDVPRPHVTVNVPRPAVPKIAPKVDVPKPAIAVRTPKVDVSHAKPVSTDVEHRPTSDLPRAVVNGATVESPKATGVPAGPVQVRGTDPPKLLGETAKSAGAAGQNVTAVAPVAGSSQLSLSNGTFGKATRNPDGTVTISNNLGSVTLTPQQMSKVVAGDMSALKPLMGNGAAGQAQAVPIINSNGNVTQVQLPNGTFGKAVMNSDGSVTVSNNLGTVTLTKQQMKNVAAGDMSALKRLMATAPSSGGTNPSSAPNGLGPQPAPNNATAQSISPTGPLQKKAAANTPGNNPAGILVIDGNGDGKHVAVTSGWGQDQCKQCVANQNYVLKGDLSGSSNCPQGSCVYTFTPNTSSCQSGGGGCWKYVSAAPGPVGDVGTYVSVPGNPALVVAGNPPNPATPGIGTQNLGPKTWGFYQPGDPRPVTVFRLGDPVPFMPNVPDPAELGPGNWYSYGYNPPPPPEPEDTPQQQANNAPQANAGGSGQGNGGGPQGNAGGSGPSGNESAGKPFTPGSTDDPNCVAGCYDPRLLNDIGIQPQFADGTLAPPPPSSPGPNSGDLLQDLHTLEKNQLSVGRQIMQQAYGERLDDGRVNQSVDAGIIITAGGCFGDCAGLTLSFGSASGVTLFSIDPEKSVGYGNLSGIAFTNNARGVAGQDSVYGSFDGIGVTGNPSGFAIGVSPLPGAAYTYSNEIGNLHP